MIYEKPKRTPRTQEETEKLHLWIYQRLGLRGGEKSAKSLFLQMKKEDQDYLCQWGNPISVLVANLVIMMRDNHKRSPMIVLKRRVCVGEKEFFHTKYPIMETRYYRPNPLLRLVK